MKLLLLLYSHGFPEHTETKSMDSVLLAPVDAVDILILSGHWQTSTYVHKFKDKMTTTYLVSMYSIHKR